MPLAQASCISGCAVREICRVKGRCTKPLMQAYPDKFIQYSQIDEKVMQAITAELNNNQAKVRIPGKGRV
jgi:hypothetical protein